MSVPHRLETIAIQGLHSPIWTIINFKFPTDPANDFRTVYPLFIDIFNTPFKFYKNTRSGRTMYKQATEQEVLDERRY